jgi:hypothetical protein
MTEQNKESWKSFVVPTLIVALLMSYCCINGLMNRQESIDGTVLSGTVIAKHYQAPYSIFFGLFREPEHFILHVSGVNLKGEHIDSDVEISRDEYDYAQPKGTWSLITKSAPAQKLAEQIGVPVTNRVFQFVFYQVASCESNNLGFKSGNCAANIIDQIDHSPQYTAAEKEQGRKMIEVVDDYEKKATK